MSYLLQVLILISMTLGPASWSTEYLRITSTMHSAGLLRSGVDIYEDSTIDCYIYTFDDGYEITLPRNYGPDDYWDSCSNANDNNTYCCKLLLLWGRILIENPPPSERRLDDEEIEVARGWNFIRYAYNSLLNDLNQSYADQEHFRERLGSHIRAPVSPPPNFSQGPHDILVTAIKYHLLIWDNLPEEPPSYLEFRYKFDVGEYLKTLISDLTHDCDYDFYDSVLKFLDEAYSFHQLTFPDDCPTNCPDEIHSAIPSEFYRFIRGVVYAKMHGGNALEPLPILSNSDLKSSHELIDSMYRRGLIQQEEYELKTAYFDSCIIATDIANCRYWLNRFQVVGDKKRVIESMMQLTEIYRDIAEYDSAEVFAERTYHVHRELGNKERWIPALWDVINYKIHGEKWNDAMTLFDKFDDQQYDYLIVTNPDLLRTIVRGEQFVAETLGLPDKAVSAVSKWDAAVADYKSFKSTPAFDILQQQIVEERDLQTKRKLFLSVLEEDSTPSYYCYKMKIDFINTLQKFDRFDEATELALTMLPEAVHWQGKSGQADLTSVVLENQLSSGDFGGFLKTLNELEKVGRELKGDNWIDFDVIEIAEALFYLQNYRRAEELLNSYLQTIRELRMRDPLIAGSRNQAMLLLARIQLKLGRKNAAMKIVNEFDEQTATLQLKAGEIFRSRKSKVKALIQLAQIYSDADMKRYALERLQRALPEIDPAVDFGMWTEVMIQLSQLRLALDESPDTAAAGFEERVPRLHDVRDLNAKNAVLMDIFLSDYYVFKGDMVLAKARLTRALALAKDLELSDELLVIFSKLGEHAYKLEDFAEADKQLGKALDVLNTISKNIETDISKVGYRRERQRVLPLYVKTLHKRYLLTNNPVYLEEMFKKAEMGKSRALAELILAEENESLLQGLDLDSLRNVLGDRGAILEYYIPEGVDDIVYRFFIDGDTLMVDTLDIRAEELNSGIAYLLNNVDSHPFDETDFKEMAANLASQLLPEDLYYGNEVMFRYLYIVPTGNLHLFPFHLLVDAQGQYLDDNTGIDIAYLPNTTILLRPRTEKTDSHRSGAFVNPSLDPKHHDVLVDNIELRKTLAQTFHEWADCPLEWEKRLTKSDFLERMDGLENVFIYSHARFLPNDPMSSYIKLASRTGMSGNLSAMDLQTAETGSGLWTLAGCSSGRERIQSGDEVLGLPRAILRAGASVVVVSLWDVIASSSLRLMNDFYKNLARGLSTAEALREARTRCRSSGHDPRFWAPFVMIGYHGYE